MPIEFDSQTSELNVKQLVASHYDLYKGSDTYKNIVENIKATGKTVAIVATDTGTNFVTSVVGDKIIIAIPAESLKKTNYVTNQSTGDNEIQSLERVLAHEMKHAEEYADGTLVPGSEPTDGSHELRAVDAENDVMDEFAGEAFKDATGSGGYEGSTTLRTPDDIYTSDPSTGNDFNAADPDFPPPITIKKEDDPFGNRGDSGTQNNHADEIDNELEDANAEATPLVLDLDGDGIELTSLNSAGDVYWDVDSDGFAENTGWVDADDGFLAYDSDADGIINDSTELFGDQTGYSNGFLALGSHDSNNDGVINSDDTIWSDLLVWQDENTNGYSESTELKTLDSLNITEIDLGYSNVSIANSGHTIKQESTFTINGNTRDIVDVYFDYSDLNSVYYQDYALDEAALGLPDMRGYGELPNFSIAISLDNNDSDPDSLLSLVDDFSNLTFSQIFTDDNSALEDVVDIMYRWAGVDSVATDSRGEYIDARKVEFIETFTGRAFVQRAWETNPQWQASEHLEEAFNTGVQNIAARLIAQTAGADLFSGDPAYNAATDSFDGITGLDTSTLSTLETMGSSASDKETFWGNVVRVIDNTVGVDNLSTSDETALDTAINNTDVSLDLQDILDFLEWNSSVPTVTGGDSGNNTISGGSGDDEIYGYDGDDTLSGGTGIDRLYGGDHDDTLNGEIGADLIYGGSGDDTYIYNAGHGDDVYQEAGSADVADKIEFGAGIDITDLTFTRVGSTDLLIEIDNGTDTGSIVIENQFNYAGGGGSIESLLFSDTSTYTLTDKNYISQGTAFDDTIYGTAAGGLDADTIYGGDGNDTLYGGAPNQNDYEINTIYGEAGADNIFGDRGDDVLDGGAGNDYLFGDTGADSLTGGTGNDIIHGGSGNDTYYYNVGDGDDTYQEDGSDTGDKIVFGAGITFNDLTFTRFGNHNLLIEIDGGGSIMIERQTNTGEFIETLEFSDTSTVSMATVDMPTYGTSGDDSLSGVTPTDGASGVDTIYGGAGNDTIYVKGNNSYEYLANSAYGEDGDDYLYGSRGDDNLYGGDGNDELRGDQGNDILSGGAGDDYLRDSQGSGDDTYLYQSGLDSIYNYKGDDTLVIDSSYTVNDITFDSSTYNHVVVFDAGVDEIELIYAGYNGHYQIDNIVFSDGFESDQFGDAENWIWGTDTYNFTTGTTGDDVVVGKGGDDDLSGNAGADDIHGGSGADMIDGGTGDDFLHGGTGDDEIYGGSGNDIMFGGDDADTFIFESGTTSSYIDTISDFSVGDGDMLDIADLLTGYDPMTDLITDFIQITDDGTDSALAVDADGGADNFVQIATLLNVTGLTDEAALESAGTLITV